MTGAVEGQERTVLPEISGSHLGEREGLVEKEQVTAGLAGAPGRRACPVCLCPHPTDTARDYNCPVQLLGAGNKNTA